MPPEPVIEAMTAADWPEVVRIYRQGIESGNATFAAEPPEWSDWDAGHLAEGRRVARVGSALAGWIALSPVSSRPVYRGVAEASLYVDEAWQRRGIGDRLLAALVAASEAAGIWTLQGGIFPENRASLALFARHGFETLGRHTGLGRMDYGPHAGRWRDVVRVERRSRVAGHN